MSERRQKSRRERYKVRDDVERVMGNRRFAYGHLLRKSSHLYVPFVRFAHKRWTIVGSIPFKYLH